MGQQEGREKRREKGREKEEEEGRERRRETGRGGSSRRRGEMRRGERWCRTWPRWGPGAQSRPGLTGTWLTLRYGGRWGINDQFQMPGCLITSIL